jgi:hypothetical protein
MDRYSASVLDRDTTGRFLGYQEIKHGPRKTPNCGTSVKRILSPVQVTIGMKIERATSEQKASIWVAFVISNDPFGSSEMSCCGAMQKLTKLIYRVGDIWPSECAVLQGTHNVSVKRGITQWITIKSSEFLARGARC